MIESSEKVSSQISKSLRRSRILLVEPDRLTRWSVHEYLKKCFEVATADNAEAAMQLLASKSFDAIIVANDLPTDGADRIEHLARDQNVPLLVIRTTTASASNKQHGPLTVFLEKPFELSELANVLNSYVGSNKTTHG